MPSIPILSKLQEKIEYKIRNTNTKVFNWILQSGSQPLKVSNKSAIVFAPHQDDETLGCGGMIALKRSQGVPVKVMFLTDGRYGRPEWVKPEDIIPYRQQEAKNALNHLGVEPSEIEFLNYTDGSLAKLPHEQRQQLIAHLVDVLKSFQPGEVYVTHGKDGHPDHEYTYEIVRCAIAQSQIPAVLLQYPIWVFWYNLLPLRQCFQSVANSYCLNISSVYEQKKQAMNYYHSQLPNLPNSLLNSFFSPYEIFIKS
jgi:N-acetylglucosamine malate deacetylase 1